MPQCAFIPAPTPIRTEDDDSQEVGILECLRVNVVTGLLGHDEFVISKSWLVPRLFVLACAHATSQRLPCTPDRLSSLICGSSPAAPLCGGITMYADARSSLHECNVYVTLPPYSFIPLTDSEACAVIVS